MTAFVLLILGQPALAQGVNPAAVAGLDGQHPAEYMRRSKELFEAGRRDDAVFAYYFGQLRYRRFLVARPQLQNSKDAALLQAFVIGLGPAIQAYAYGDIPRFARSLDAVLAHDLKAPDRVTAKNDFPQAHESVRRGLRQVRVEIVRRQAQIRAERAKAGLPNRG